MLDYICNKKEKKIEEKDAPELKCKKCGFVLYDGNLFCTNCGSKIAEDNAIQGVKKCLNNAPDKKTSFFANIKSEWSLKKILGDYVYENNGVDEYFTISEIRNNSVIGYLRANMRSGGITVEHFSGDIKGSIVELRVSSCDEKLKDKVIPISNGIQIIKTIYFLEFKGIVEENSITGEWITENGDIRFRKYVKSI